ncbi:hypothetical protein H6G89_04390 [Oscillatoria sp. FACHB-1407]|uniref:hypothetical protein n=1 Tax=Oscillatoria sp. FACHB-1407 TaxID=2692847 RepID=UPI001685F451|nr:hypothetical protein [Oscillatoria sp. FACHB-1407]MBD2460276.1 hypothetical protein [Oscillatoria sp. FACHB-1407]
MKKFEIWSIVIGQWSLVNRSTRTPENAGFDEPTQVGFALIAAVLTAEILVPNSR